MLASCINCWSISRSNLSLFKTEAIVILYFKYYLMKHFFYFPCIGSNYTFISYISITGNCITLLSWKTSIDLNILMDLKTVSIKCTALQFPSRIEMWEFQKRAKTSTVYVNESELI